MTEGGGRRGEGEETTSEGGASDVRKLVFGAIGGALAGLGPRLVTYPFEVLKSRSQVRTAIHKSAALPSVPLSSIVRETWKRHGLRKGFFPGVHVALLGTIPGSATYFFGYELGKSVFQSEYVQRQMGATGTSLGRSAWFEGALCGVTAQCIANIVFTPVDITKERMQVQANLVATGKQPRLYTATEMIVRIARNEGGSIDHRFPVACPAGLTRHILSPCKSFAPFSQSGWPQVCTCSCVATGGGTCSGCLGARSTSRPTRLSRISPTPPPRHHRANPLPPRCTWDCAPALLPPSLPCARIP